MSKPSNRLYWILWSLLSTGAATALGYTLFKAEDKTLFLCELSQAGIFGILFIVTLPALTAGMLQAFFVVDHARGGAGVPPVAGARRRLAAGWADALAHEASALGLERVTLAWYRHAGSNNADLPTEAMPEDLRWNAATL